MGHIFVLTPGRPFVTAFSYPEAPLLLVVSTKNRSRFLVLTKKSATSGDENVMTEDKEIRSILINLFIKVELNTFFTYLPD